MNTKTRQQGIGGLGLLIILAALGSMGYVGMKLVPPYLEQKKVMFIQESTASQPGASVKSRGQLQEEMLRRLSLEDIDDVGRKELFITKEGGQWQIRVAYNKQIKLFEQIDILMKYDETVEVPR